MNELLENLRPVLGRIVGVFIPFAITRLGQLFNYEFSQETIDLTKEVSLILLVYVVSSHLVTRRINPGNAASPRIVRAEAIEDSALKQEEKWRSSNKPD